MLKSISEMLLNWKDQTAWCKEILQHEVVSPIIQDGKPVWRVKNEDRLSVPARTYLGFCRQHSVTLTEAYVMSQLVKIGPKIFRPTQLQFQMLEYMTVNVPVEEYTQPFDTVVFEFPENYYQAKALGEPSLLGLLRGYEPTKGDHKPIFLMMHYHREMKVLSTSLMFDSVEAIKSVVFFKPGTTIEESLQDAFKGEHPTGLFITPTSAEEDKINEDIIRSAINYCLLVDELGGAKCHGPHNPKHYARLQKHANGDVDPRKARQELRMHPIVYSIDQNIELFKVSATPLADREGEPTGRSVSPHWRRGFYRRQHHGPQNSLTKRVRIPAVFVKKDLFGGDMVNSISKYK
jgi:hypothetical protein